MKKKIIWIIAALVVIGAAVAAVFLLGGKEQSMETPPNDAGLTHIQLLRLDKISELEEYVQNNDLVLQTSDDPSLTSIGSIPISGHYMTLYVQADENGDFCRVDGMLDLFLENKSVSKLESALDEFCNAVAQLLDIDRTFTYTVYSGDGYEIDPATDGALQEILNGTAYFALSAVDADESFWHAEATVDEADRLAFSFWHNMEPEEELLSADANIVLADIAGTEEG